MKVTVKHKQSLMDVTVENYGQIDNLVSVSNDNDISISEVLETSQELTVNSENKGDNEIKDKIITQGLSFNNDSKFITELESIEIGDQIWTLKNWDFNYPGSRVYNDSESNLDTYGRLYNWNMVTAPDFAPDGWHVPSLSEWNTLISFLGGSSVAGGKLKELGITHWSTPNTGATNESVFTGLPGGYWRLATGYVLLTTDAYFWTKSEFDIVDGEYLRLKHDSNSTLQGHFPKSLFYLSVRLIQD